MMSWKTERCFYCNRKVRKGTRGSHFPSLKTRDHLIPKRLRQVSLLSLSPAQQGCLTVTCCYECNHKKTDKHPLEFAEEVKLSPLRRMLIEQVWRWNVNGVN